MPKRVWFSGCNHIETRALNPLKRIIIDANKVNIVFMKTKCLYQNFHWDDGVLSNYAFNFGTFKRF